MRTCYYHIIKTLILIKNMCYPENIKIPSSTILGVNKDKDYKNLLSEKKQFDELFKRVKEFASNFSCFPSNSRLAKLHMHFGENISYS